jgi:hypothetical protein
MERLPSDALSSRSASSSSLLHAYVVFLEHGSVSSYFISMPRRRRARRRRRAAAAAAPPPRPAPAARHRRIEFAVGTIPVNPETVVEVVSKTTPGTEPPFITLAELEKSMQQRIENIDISGIVQDARKSLNWASLQALTAWSGVTPLLSTTTKRPRNLRPHSNCPGPHRPKPHPSDPKENGPFVLAPHRDAKQVAT